MVMAREIAAADAAVLFELLSDPIVVEHVSSPPPSISAFEGFIRWAHAERAAGRSVCFGIVPEGLDAAVGIIQLRALDPDWFNAEWGFAIASAFWSTGVFIEAANLVAEFAFTTLNVHRIEARSVEQNARGQAALQKLGARAEAVLARGFRKGGRIDRQLLWTLTEADWRQHPLIPDRISVGQARARIADAIASAANAFRHERRDAGDVMSFPFFLTQSDPES